MKYARVFFKKTAMCENFVNLFKKRRIFTANGYNIYSIKGIIASICYLFLSKACYLVMLFIITFLAIKISYKIILVCFSKQEINIKKEIEKYIKILIIAFIFVIVISLAKVFIDPMLIKLFTRC